MKHIYTALTIVVFLMFTAVTFGQGIVNTKHNLSVNGPNTLQGAQAEICVYCHTPHGGERTIADDTGPLWNRAYTPGSFTVYESYTLDTTPSAPPTSVSKACLSCHDGTLGLNQLRNLPGAGSGTPPANATDIRVDGTGATNNMALIGTDLRDDHPVSVTYRDALSFGTGDVVGTNSHQAGFRADSTLASGRVVVQNGGVTLPLYGAAAATAQVECGSCHDPHEERSLTGTTNPSVYFLRIPNDDSDLCVTCHLK